MNTTTQDERDMKLLASFMREVNLAIAAGAARENVLATIMMASGIAFGRLEAKGIDMSSPASAAEIRADHDSNSQRDYENAARMVNNTLKLVVGFLR